MGLPHGIPNWNFYMAFTFFRVAAILQGVYKRSLMSMFSSSLPCHSSPPPAYFILFLCFSWLFTSDQSSSDNAAAVGSLAEDFANKGWSLANKMRAGTNAPPTGFGSTRARTYSTDAARREPEITPIGTAIVVQVGPMCGSTLYFQGLLLVM